MNYKLRFVIEPQKKESKKFSVIIIAYNRRDFLMNAIRSVINQSVAKDSYEIICVTNFEVDLSSFINIPIKLVNMNGSIGEFISKAISISTSNYICILEDDDEFEPTKLEMILEMEKKVNFDYYKNSMSIINQNGELISKKYEHEIYKEISPLIVDLEYYNKVRTTRKTFILRSFPSTLTFRREVVINYLSDLKRIESEVGLFLFYKFIDDNKIIVYDTHKTTKYRIHDVSDSSAKDFKKYIIVRKNYIKRTLKTYNILLLTIKNNKLLKIINYEKSYLECQYIFFSGKKPNLKLFFNNLFYLFYANVLSRFLVICIRDVISIIVSNNFYIKTTFIIDSRNR